MAEPLSIEPDTPEVARAMQLVVQNLLRPALGNIGTQSK